jgi:hypothetical protein
MQPASQPLILTGISKHRIAYISTFWRILVGNGKWGNRPDAKVITSKVRRTEMCKSNRLEEVEMSAKRLFTLFVIAGFVAVVAFAAQGAFATGNHTYHQSQQQALREYILGERYGVLPKAPAQFTAQQVAREYQLGERYGVLPPNSIRFGPAEAAREYQLGERYGQTPEQFARQQALREYQLGERYGVLP